MASRLPLELVNMIFDELLLLSITQSMWDYHDKGFMHTLHACSLVCQAWALPVQRRIFTNIKLNFRTDEPKDLLRILDVSPHIAPFVKSLTIDTHNDIHTGVIGSLAEHMKDVSELTLMYVDLGNEEWDSTLLTSFKSIRYLSLDQSVIKFDVFAAILKNHPHIETLDLSPVFWRDDESSALRLSLDPSTPLRVLTGTLPKLRNISLLERSICSKFVDWMIMQHCTRNIEEAVFASVAANEAPALGRLIDDIGPALKYLMIREFSGSHTVEMAQVVAQSISLAKCTALHTLEFVVTYSIDADLEWLLVVLAGVTSTEIETINLYINLDDEDEDVSLDRINLSRIDDILIGANFGTLRKVYLQFGYPIPRSNWQREEVVGRLDGLNLKGILEVE